MHTRILSVAIIIIFVIGLIGCFYSSEQILFPTYFTRDYDGVQIWLGMTSDEIGQILEPLPGYYSESGHWHYEIELGFIRVLRNDADEMFMISMVSEYWELAGGISVGDNIQSIIALIDGGRFEHFRPIHSTERRSVSIIDAESLEDSQYAIFFIYNENGIIKEIRLIDVPKERAWHHQEQEEL